MRTMTRPNAAAAAAAAPRQLSLLTATTASSLPPLHVPSLQVCRLGAECAHHARVHSRRHVQHLLEAAAAAHGRGRRRHHLQLPGKGLGRMWEAGVIAEPAVECPAATPAAPQVPAAAWWPGLHLESALQLSPPCRCSLHTSLNTHLKTGRRCCCGCEGGVWGFGSDPVMCLPVCAMHELLPLCTCPPPAGATAGTARAQAEWATQAMCVLLGGVDARLRCRVGSGRPCGVGFPWRPRHWPVVRCFHGNARPAPMLHSACSTRCGCRCCRASAPPALSWCGPGTGA